jgi:anti-anti-sigma factor
VNISEDRKPGVLILALSQRLDATTAKIFQDNGLAIIEAGDRRLVIDLAQLNYVSSGGLRVFLLAAKRLSAVDGKLAVCALNDHVRQVFDIAGFSSNLSIYPSRDGRDSFFFDLPHKRHQSIPHFLSILRISRQILVQESFLIQKPPYERRHKQDEREEPPPRAERKRGPYKQRKHSGIHRVAYDGVRARRDDRLSLGYLDSGSSITILANDEVHQQKSKRDQEVAYQRDVRRDGRPHKATVECRNNQERDESQQRENHDDFLRRLLFRRWPDLHAPLQKLRILYREIHRDGGRRSHEDGHKDKRLPVIERPRRHKKKRRHHEKA